ncbi:MAG: protein translocase subunit SecD, partial [Proteobacteria bacterium]|nr:protein translocase subunit SecD [Pseudomonadota bacterium]
MNRYPLWKYAILLVALLVGVLYTLPNFFGEAPAVQVSSAKATLKIEADFAARVRQLLEAGGVQPDFVQFDGNSVKARLADTDAQIKARDVLDKALNTDPADPRYIVALNLLSRSPAWLARIHALPMYLGLDLRGGVHFLMQVDMKAALTKKAESVAGDMRTLLRDKGVRHGGISRVGDTVELRARDDAMLRSAQALLSDQLPDWQWAPAGSDA